MGGGAAAESVREGPRTHHFTRLVLHAASMPWHVLVCLSLSLSLSLRLCLRLRLRLRLIVSQFQTREDAMVVVC